MTTTFVYEGCRKRYSLQTGWLSDDDLPDWAADFYRFVFGYAVGEDPQSVAGHL